MTIGDYILMGMTGLISFLTIVEKSQKIKWRPISWLLGKEETNKKIEEVYKLVKILSDKIDKLSEDEIEHYRKQAKILISGFATDLRVGGKKKISPLNIKSETEFISIADLCKEYLDKGWNSKVKHDAKYICDIYESIDKQCDNEEN